MGVAGLCLTQGKLGFMSVTGATGMLVGLEATMFEVSSVPTAMKVDLTAIWLKSGPGGSSHPWGRTLVVVAGVSVTIYIRVGVVLIVND